MINKIHDSGSYRSWLSDGVTTPPLPFRIEGEGGGMLLLDGALSIMVLAGRLCCLSMECPWFSGIRVARDTSSGLALDMDDRPVVPVLKSSLLVAVLCTAMLSVAYTAPTPAQSLCL